MNDRSNGHDHHYGDHHGEAEDEQALHEQFKRLRVGDLAYEMMIGLVTVGYQKLGLTEHTRDLRDLDDAHLAIELLRATLRVLERDAGRDQFKDIRATLAQMQLGYAEAARAAEGAAAGADEAAEMPPAVDEPAAGSD